MSSSVSSGVLLVLAIAQLVIVLAVARGGHPAGGGAGPSSSEKPPRERYYWKLFYVNPDDPRGIVPKRWGIGWTVNFRSKAIARLFAILVAATVVFATLLVT